VYCFYTCNSVNENVYYTKRRGKIGQTKHYQYQPKDINITMNPTIINPTCWFQLFLESTLSYY